jgi:regulator of protease activity HflC (stomatin/prohibitin superfamily)
MLGIRFIKFDAMTYVIHYKKGRVAREGRGLAFYYYEPSSSIAAIPLGSNDVPFIFNETTLDYQTISIQGQISYRVSDAKKLAEVLDFTVDAGGSYKKDESEKLTQRISNEAQTATSALVHAMPLKDTLRAAKAIEEKIFAGLKGSVAVNALGLEVLAVNVLAVRGTPEMERALEAETREGIQQNADQAIYARRNFAVVEERKIKESELNTEIAVEEKKKQIVEKRWRPKFSLPRTIKSCAR